MTLKDLLEESDVVAVQGSMAVGVQGLAYDSRRVRPGDAFFALAGLQQDGRAYARAAVELGAVAVIGQGLEPLAVPTVEVAEPRRALAAAAARWHRHPSRALQLVGVTGTNGKTTITWMLESIFRAAGRSPGVIGTTGLRFGGQDRALSFTTPEAPELQGFLREMVEARVQAVAIEVSSHALAQRRSFGLECDVAVFTNLSHDHLDYHGSMEAYLDAKLMLFDGRNGTSSKRRFAVVNVDDPRASRVVEAARRGGLEIVTVGMETEGSKHVDADLRVEGIEVKADGLELQVWPHFPPGLATPGGVHLRLPLLGRYNAVNAILAFAAARALGIPIDAIVRGLESMPAVPGRLERVQRGQPFDVAVDYAHTPDALARSLAAAREHAGGRVLLVFGCGGDRDRAKRPEMGRVAATASDRAWVTSDNPRGEDPERIVAEILAGAPAGRLAVEIDRRAAIAAALEAAQPGDFVLIAGKGHETTQTIGDRVLPFDDRAVARELLATRGVRP